MVCVPGRTHTVPVLLPVVPMKTVMGHRSVVVMAVEPGVWNQVRIDEAPVPCTLISLVGSVLGVCYEKCGFEHRQVTTGWGSWVRHLTLTEPPSTQHRKFKPRVISPNKT